jgi:hypothetical protein
LALFEALEMPEADQVRRMLASFEGWEGGNEPSPAREAPPSPPGNGGSAAVSASLPADLLAQLEAQLTTLPPEQQAAARQLIAQLRQMAPAEIEALIASIAHEKARAQAEQIAAAARAARAQNEEAALIPQLETAAAHFAEGESPGSPYDQLAQFTRAVLALLKGESPPPAPEAHAEIWVALRRDFAGPPEEERP